MANSWEIFNSKSTSRLSNPFHIGVGEQIEFLAFDFQDKDPDANKCIDDFAMLYRVQLELPPEISKSNCGCSGNDLTQVVEKDVKVISKTPPRQCGVWGVTTWQNTAWLSIPGDYVLVLGYKDMVGQVKVLATRYGPSERMHIPEDLYFGKIS